MSYFSRLSADNKLRSKMLKEKPECQLSGTDGNVFLVIAKVKKALNRAGQKKQIDLFDQRVKQAVDYAEVLSIANDFVEIT